MKLEVISSSSSQMVPLCMGMIGRDRPNDGTLDTVLYDILVHLIMAKAPPLQGSDPRTGGRMYHGTVM